MRIIAIAGLIMFSGLLSAQDVPVKLKPLDLSKIRRAPLKALPPLTTRGYVHPTKPSTTEQIAALNKPATVRVLAQFTGTIQYQPMNIYTENLQLAVNQIATNVLTGQIPNNNADKLSVLLQMIEAAMEGYLVADPQIKEEQLNLGSTGSGMIVTPQGHVVTNAHVVSSAMPAITQNLILSSISNRSSDLSKYLQQVYPINGDLPEGAQRSLQNILERFYTNNYFKLSGINASYFIQTGFTIQNPAFNMKATLLTAGEPVPGKDVAVLKISGVQFNLPTVAFGDDKALKTGENVYVLGYPGVVEENEILSQGTMREPSYTPGIVSARQRTSMGWEAIQISASAAHGNSGGPVFNQYGEVVGMLTFGSLDKNAPGVIVQGFNFMVPNTVINEFIVEAGVLPQISDNTIAYKAAMELAADEEYKDALEKLEGIKTSYQQFPYLDAEISGVQAKMQENSSWYSGLWEGLSTRTKIIGGVAGLFVVFWIGRKIFG